MHASMSNSVVMMALSKIVPSLNYVSKGILFCIFIIFMVKAILELRSEKTGVTTTLERLPTRVPSFTICPWTLPAKLKNGIAFEDVIKELNVGNLTKKYMNIRSSFAGQSLDELWSVHCKFLHNSSNCTPCLTLNAPQDWIFGKTKLLSLGILQSPYQIDKYTLEVHENGQSSAVKNGLDLESIQVYKLEQNVTGYSKYKPNKD